MSERTWAALASTPTGHKTYEQSALSRTFALAQIRSMAAEDAGCHWSAVLLSDIKERKA